jgi:putative oxidoreductase
MNFLSKYSDQAYAFLRIVSGFLFAFHGMQKILGIMSDFQAEVGTQAWFGGIIELVGGAMIMLGLKTSIAAFICSGTMAVAYFQFHWKGQFGPEFFPAINKGEPAVLYCFIFLYLACRGSGIWAIDCCKSCKSI